MGHEVLPTNAKGLCSYGFRCTSARSPGSCYLPGMDVRACNLLPDNTTTFEPEPACKRRGEPRHSGSCSGCGPGYAFSAGRVAEAHLWDHSELSEPCQLERFQAAHNGREIHARHA